MGERRCRAAGLEAGHGGLTRRQKSHLEMPFLRRALRPGGPEMRFVVAGGLGAMSSTPTKYVRLEYEKWGNTPIHKCKRALT
jgi:hypothetical protein